jgi:hypothetical protein
MAKGTCKMTRHHFDLPLAVQAVTQMGDDDQRGVAWRPFGCAMDCLAARLDRVGLGHADAFNIIGKWAMEGVLDCEGDKPKTHEHVKITPGEWVHLEPDIEISTSPDRICKATSILLKGLSVAFVNVVVNWRQFERLVEEIAPASAPAGNFRRLRWYADQVARISQKWLSRRDRGRRLLWSRIEKLAPEPAPAVPAILPAAKGRVRQNAEQGGIRYQLAEQLQSFRHQLAN